TRALHSFPTRRSSDLRRSRKEALDRWKAQQRAAARAKLPLPDAQLKALFDMLDADLSRRGCNHTLRLVREWLSRHGLELEPVERSEEHTSELQSPYDL